MAVESNPDREIVFVPRRDLRDPKLIEAFETLGYKVQERPRHPLVRAIRQMMIKYLHARVTGS